MVMLLIGLLVIGGLRVTHATEVAVERRRGRASPTYRFKNVGSGLGAATNAISRNRGLRQLGVRGRRKVILLRFALAHGMMRELALRDAALEAARSAPDPSGN